MEKACQVLGGRALLVERGDRVDVLVVETGDQSAQRGTDLDEVETHAFLVQLAGFEQNLDLPAMAVHDFGKSPVGAQRMGGFEAVANAERIGRHRPILLVTTPQGDAASAKGFAEPRSVAADTDKLAPMLRRTWPAWLLVPLLFLVYGKGLGRGFTSEDFLILRRLAGGDFFTRAAESFTGPWLGVTFVGFYRPFSSLLLQLELLAFGVSPLPYLLLHLALHGVCALGLAAWLGRLDAQADRRQLFLVALVFALYPLHPNTVLFIASFATLFATLFVFATLYLEAAGRRSLALVVAPLALLSYEQAVVLPGLLLFFDVARKRGGWRSRLHLWPYFAITVAYLLLRRQVLGGGLGGYDAFRQRLLDPAALLGSLGEVASRLFVPVYTLPASRLSALLVLAVLAVIAGLALARREEPGARIALAALLALPLVQAPFVFTGVVPGNGRYFYLAAAFVAIVLWQGFRLLLARRESWVAAAQLAVALLAAISLWQVVEVYAQAADRCGNLRRRLEAAPAGRLFVAGRPLFAQKWGVPVAQIFHWGLADAMKPPFTERVDLEVYPLPELEEAALAPLLGRPDLGRAVSLGEGDLLLELAAPTTVPARLEAPDFPRIGIPPGTRLRLVVLAEGGPSVLDLPPLPGDAAGEASGEALAEVPKATLDSMRELYHAPIFVWVEVRGAGFELLAVSEVFEL